MTDETKLIPIRESEVERLGRVRVIDNSAIITDLDTINLLRSLADRFSSGMAYTAPLQAELDALRLAVVRADKAQPGEVTEEWQVAVDLADPDTSLRTALALYPGPPNKEES